MLGLCTIVACFAALYLARAIFIPVAFSLFIIALVWPLQSALQKKIPTLVALAITISVTAIVTPSLHSWSSGVSESSGSGCSGTPLGFRSSTHRL